MLYYYYYLALSLRSWHFPRLRLIPLGGDGLLRGPPPVAAQVRCKIFSPRARTDDHRQARYEILL